MPDRPTTRTGLASLVIGAAANEGGHLVLADWLEDHLDRNDLAAVLRLSVDDPRDEQLRELTDFGGFRYEFVDAEVMLYMSRWKVYQPYRAGKKAGPEPEGALLGLCVSAEVTGKLIRWVRWLPDTGSPTAEVQALWDRLGEAIPQSPSAESPSEGSE
jgi:hypothetical protein